MSAQNTITHQYYSNDEQEEFRPILMEKIRQKKGQIKILKETVASQKENCHTGDHIENCNNEMTLEENQKRLTSFEEFLNENLLPALSRIDSGTYGTCRKSHGLIPKARLWTTPHATLCAEIKNTNEIKPPYRVQALNQKWVS